VCSSDLLSARPRWPPRRERALLVTVSFHPWFVSDSGALPVGDEEIEGVAGSLTRLLDRRVVDRVTFASTAQGLGGARWALEDDLIAARAVTDHLPDELAGRVMVAPGYLSPGDYMRLAARHSAVVSMRMHGAILAAVSGTPALLANAAAKVRWAGDVGFEALRSRHELGLLDDRLAPLLSGIRRWRRDQRQAVEQLRRLAERNARLVAELL